MKRLSILAMVLLACAFVCAQQPSTQKAPDYAANARYANGRAIGYAPHCTSTSGGCPGSDRVIHIGPGSTNCSGTMSDESAQTITVSNSTPRYVYKDPASSCAFAESGSSDMTGLIPFYKVTVGGGVITAIQDWTGAPAVSTVQVTGNTHVVVSFSGSATASRCLHTDASGNAVVASGDCATSGSTGTVTSIATTSPITGGTITSTGTIACATCVTSSSPGAGIAHFAGSTQAVTSSAIVNADITNSTIDLTAKVTGILPAANGGTNNGFFQVSGPASSTKTFTFPNSSQTMSYTIASGAKALATSAISSGACSSAQTDTATGTLTTDAIIASFNGDPTAVTGYIPSTSGMLTIIVYPTADTFNAKVCNNSSASITPGAITINWRVVR